MRNTASMLGLLLLSNACFSTTRYSGADPSGQTQACVASCDRAGGDVEECLARCPGIAVEHADSCPASSPNLVCETHTHVRPGPTALIVVGLVAVVAAATIGVVASSHIGFIPN